MNPILDYLVYANFVEAMREFGRWQKSSQVIERDGLLMVAGSTDFAAFMNYVIRLDAQIPASEVINQAKVFFSSLNRGFTLCTYGEFDRDLEKTAEDYQREVIFDLPVMTLQTQVSPPVLPDNVELRLCTSVSEILDVRNINSEAFESIGFPGEQVQAMFGVPHRVLSPKFLTYIAYLDGQPAATAMAVMSEQVAGIYWVGTIPVARGRGLAEACVRKVTNEGLSRGAQIATLQASQMGESLYERIGYRSSDRVKCFLFPMS